MSRLLLALAAALLAAGWFWRADLQAWAQPVADGAVALQAKPAAAGAGGLRKCVRGQETSYTNEACPPGFQEKAVDGSRLSVLPGTTPAPPASAASTANSHQRLQNLLDVKPDANLKDRMMERAISGPSR